MYTGKTAKTPRNKSVAPKWHQILTFGRKNEYIRAECANKLLFCHILKSENKAFAIQDITIGLRAVWAASADMGNLGSGCACKLKASPLILAKSLSRAFAHHLVTLCEVYSRV